MSRRGWWAEARTVGVLAFAAVTVVCAGWVLVRDPAPAPPLSTPRPTGTASQTSAAPLVSLWLGDSYTGGTGAADPAHGEACLTAERLHWLCTLDAQGGTGFIADGHINSKTFAPLGDRLKATAAKYDPDVVVIDAGRNDWWAAKSDVEDAVRSYFSRVNEAWPNATVVVVAPYVLGDGDGFPKGVRWIGDYERTAASTYGWTFVDLTKWAADTRRLTIADGVHPSPAGHEWIAEHLADALKGVAA